MHVKSLRVNAASHGSLCGLSDLLESAVLVHQLDDAIEVIPEKNLLNFSAKLSMDVRPAVVGSLLGVSRAEFEATIGFCISLLLRTCDEKR
jgi:hypothetical protein